MAGGAVVVVPKCVAVAGGGDGTHVCGSVWQWWWCPRVWQWQAVVVVPSYVAVADGYGGAHVFGSGR